MHVCPVCAAAVLDALPLIAGAVRRLLGWVARRAFWSGRVS
jgi:hypothetical protein